MKVTITGIVPLYSPDTCFTKSAATQPRLMTVTHSLCLVCGCNGRMEAREEQRREGASVVQLDVQTESFAPVLALPALPGQPFLAALRSR